MNYSHHGRAAWLERCDIHGSPRLSVQSDHERAPISFGWWAHTPTERVSKHFHVEILYRLERAPAGTGKVMLTPTGFYGMSEQQAREYLLARQAALLPKLPTGYRWIGPQLIENICGEPRVVSRAFPSDLLPEATRRRLETARELAAAALRRRAITLPVPVQA